MRSATFEEPLPNDLHLAVLTAFETEEGPVIEMVDPSLTNADQGTGLVVVYLLVPPGIDGDARFQQALDELESGQGGRKLDLNLGEPTTCSIATDRGHCVTGADTYFMQSSYMPGKDVPNMEKVMTDIVGAAIAHYESNA